MTKSRNTRQKEIIEKEISSIGGLFDVEELYGKISKKNSDIGIATIYRFLKEMKKTGKIHHYTCGKNTIYSKSHVSHTHFICERCARKIHFQMKNMDILKGKLPGKACHIQLDIHGTCNECLKKEN